MKHWTYKQAMFELPLPPMPAGAQNISYKPFPGKWPTRIAFEMLLENGKRLCYIGKPSLSTTDLLEGGLRVRHYVEFDRGGVVHNPAIGTSYLWHLYHPNVPRGSFVSVWLPRILMRRLPLEGAGCAYWHRDYTDRELYTRMIANGFAHIVPRAAREALR